jgi:hypothetical protein
MFTEWEGGWFVELELIQLALRIKRPENIRRPDLIRSLVSGPHCSPEVAGHRSRHRQTSGQRNCAILARGAGNPAFVRAKVKRFLRLADARENIRNDSRTRD